MSRELTAIPDEISGATIGFVTLLAKGLIEDDRWDWDLDSLTIEDWKHYQEAFVDPTILKTTLAVFMNSLQIDSGFHILNYIDARFRAFQYFRASLGFSDYEWDHITPPFAEIEIAEPDWHVWEQ